MNGMHPKNSNRTILSVYQWFSFNTHGDICLQSGFDLSLYPRRLLQWTLEEHCFVWNISGYRRRMYLLKKLLTLFSNGCFRLSVHDMNSYEYPLPIYIALRIRECWSEGQYSNNMAKTLRSLANFRNGDVVMFENQWLDITDVSILEN